MNPAPGLRADEAAAESALDRAITFPLVRVNLDGCDYHIDFNRPIELSVPLGDVRAFHLPQVESQPVVVESFDFTGSVSHGASCNCLNVSLYPHGNGTHTEGIGHITQEFNPVGADQARAHFIARVISVTPTGTEDGDRVITREAIEEQLSGVSLPEALIIRTLPNSRDKLSMDYSGTNPPYLSLSAAKYIAAHGIEHLLIDLPSIDREQGDVLAHRAFWQIGTDPRNGKSISVLADVPHAPRMKATITELIFVPDSAEDGQYLLNLQLTQLPSDAVPSRPQLYRMIPL